MAKLAQQKTMLPPGPKPLPFVGNILAFRRDQLGFLGSVQQTYGDMATIHMGNLPIVLLFRPEHVRYVLSENPGNFTIQEIAGPLRQMIGDSLLTIDGDAHRQQRRLVQPVFYNKRIERYSHFFDALNTAFPSSASRAITAIQDPAVAGLTSRIRK